MNWNPKPLLFFNKPCDNPQHWCRNYIICYFPIKLTFIWKIMFEIFTASAGNNYSTQMLEGYHMVHKRTPCLISKTI